MTRLSKFAADVPATGPNTELQIYLRVATCPDIWISTQCLDIVSKYLHSVYIDIYTVSRYLHSV